MNYLTSDKDRINHKDKEVKYLSLLQNEVSQLKRLLWDNPCLYIKTNNACDITDAYCTLRLKLTIMLSAG